MNVRTTVKAIQDIMRQDVGVDGDAQRISQLCWMFRFALDHLPGLTTRPEHIQQLRQTILNLAVRGSTATTRRRLLEATLAEALGEASAPCRSPRQPAAAIRQPPQRNPAPIRPAHPPTRQEALPGLAPPEPKSPRGKPSGSIPEAILAHLQPGREYSRSEVCATLGVSTADWTWAIRQLRDEGRVVQAGQNRGARYRLAGG